MASRTLPSERDRKMTILLTPFMSCSAKLPIYSLFAVTFFPEYAALVMVGLYFLGILVGIGMAFLLKGTLFKGEAVPFVMELPNYRLPGLKNVAQLLWEKARDFLERAFTAVYYTHLDVYKRQTYATLMTLYVVPLMYDILFKKPPLNVDIGDENLDDIPDDAAEYIAQNTAQPE